jgi:hypothetical protein
LAAVTGIGARDETEGMLATQIIATHFAAISLLVLESRIKTRILGSQGVAGVSISCAGPNVRKGSGADL